MKKLPSQLSTDAFIGLKVKEYITYTAWSLRGYSNVRSDAITAYEKDKAFPKAKEHYAKTGRILFTKSKALDTVLLDVIGLAVNVCFDLSAHNISISLEQLIGFKTYNEFTARYCELVTTATKMDWKLNKDKLPSRATENVQKR